MRFLWEVTLPIMGRFYGDRISNTIEGGIVDNLNKGKISNEVNHSNGKNIYVGQSDTIKKKMLWDALDKVNDAQLIKEIFDGGKGQANCVEKASHQEVGHGAFIFGSNVKCSMQNEVVPIVDCPKGVKK
jgi:hypothetical protein